MGGGCPLVLSLCCIVVGSDSDDSEEVVLANVIHGVSALSGLITAGAEDQNVEPLIANEFFGFLAHVVIVSLMSRHL